MVTKSTKFLPENLIKMTHPVVEINYFFAHPENLLLRMIVDERKHIRLLGFRKIMKARKLAYKTELRYFRLLKINFQATHSIEVID